jgi:shikimate dehydrogenase
VITGHTKLAAVIGWPVEHSRSPQMMNAAFAAAGVDAVLVAIAAPPEGLAGAVATLRATGAIGASVTVPHKVAAMALCDEVTAQATAIGAVNCLQLTAGRVIGHNTDAGGFADALVANGVAVGGRSVVLGAGGAALAVVTGLRMAESAAVVEVVARTPRAWLPTTPWERVGSALAGANLVVDCTPVGLDPQAEAAFVAALPLDRLARDAVVMTLVYHRRTLLLERAAALGHRTLDGSDMLVYQGARAFTLWTGRPAPITAMREAVKGT